MSHSFPVSLVSALAGPIVSALALLAGPDGPYPSGTSLSTSAGLEPAPLSPEHSGALAAPAPIALKEYGERRKRLVERLRTSLSEDERGVFLWRSGKPPVQEERFHPDPSFYYLTGHEEPEAAVLLSFTRTSYEETLFLPSRDPSQEKWTGEKVGPGGVDPKTGEPDDERKASMARTGFPAVAPAERLNNALEARGGLPGAAAVWLAHDAGGLGELPTPAQAFLDLVRSRYPKVRLADPADELARLRVVKSPAEIALMERAIGITCEAQREAMRAARSSRGENELQAVIEGSFLRQGALGPAFFSIVGSGKNATVLHYTRNRGPVRPGEAIVLDVGAEFERYAADVTRTIPASGRFSHRQREVYEVVLHAQTEAAALIRPGATIEGVHKRAKEILEAAGYLKYFPHGTSHFLGLEVHDPGKRAWPFEPGVVLTVEPGIYIPEESIGVRIEDDYVVTETGARKLSASAPSNVEDVEKAVLGGERSARPLSDAKSSRPGEGR